MATDRELDRRPDPDALLALAGREGRGKLKVFLGAAPGVGKTFAMLLGARRVKAEGLDVVIGLVETHGRAETAALLEGLEVLPRKTVEYRGREIDEFDIDAALKRRPALIVVDELAHTNAPDSRHPKRWQDVEELLDAGLDVWTALNIQHLESLSEVVSRSHRRVRPRDRAGQDAEARRRRDPGRHHAGRADPAPARRQGLCAGDGQARDAELFHPAQPHRACASWRCGAPPTASTTRWSVTCARTPSRGRGTPPTICWSASAPTPRRDMLVRAGGRLADAAQRLLGRRPCRAGRRRTRDLPEVRCDRRGLPARRAARRGNRRASPAPIASDELLRYARRENITQIVVSRARRRLLAAPARSQLRRRDGAALRPISPSMSSARRRPSRRGWPRIELPAFPPRRAWIGMAAAVGAVGGAVAIGEALNAWIGICTTCR